MSTICWKLHFTKCNHCVNMQCGFTFKITSNRIWWTYSEGSELDPWLDMCLCVCVHANFTLIHWKCHFHQWQTWHSYHGSQTMLNWRSSVNHHLHAHPIIGDKRICQVFSPCEKQFHGNKPERSIDTTDGRTAWNITTSNPFEVMWYMVLYHYSW